MAKTGKTWYPNTEVVKVLIFNSKFYNDFMVKIMMFGMRMRAGARRRHELRSLLVSVLSTSPIFRLCRSHIICFASQYCSDIINSYLFLHL